MAKKRVTRVIEIDAENQTFRESTISCLEDMQKIVGGYICKATTLPNGDMIYVDDEGLIKDDKIGWFLAAGQPQPLKGNGFIIGYPDRSGYETDAKSSLEQAKAWIIFPGGGRG